MRGRYVEQHDLVGAFASVTRSLRRRIACINEVDELYAFDDAVAVDIEARDDALGQHENSRKLRRILRPVAPDFSGWNCTPITLSRSTAAANGSM